MKTKTEFPFEVLYFEGDHAGQELMRIYEMAPARRPKISAISEKNAPCVPLAISGIRMSKKGNGKPLMAIVDGVDARGMRHELLWFASGEKPASKYEPIRLVPFKNPEVYQIVIKTLVRAAPNISY